jgi:SAM-dependent methyltransferase
VAGDFDRWLLDEVVSPLPTDTILDIGCGTANILQAFKAGIYIGIDCNAGYIEEARRRFGDRATFHVASVDGVVPVEPGSFDTVLSIGVLHHLDDANTLKLFKLAFRSLKASGRLFTVDGCFNAGQTWLQRSLLRLDRGDFIRTSDAYATLAQSVFPKVTTMVRDDFLRIPYTHMVMSCSKQASSTRIPFRHSEENDGASHPSKITFEGEPRTGRI